MFLRAGELAVAFADARSRLPAEVVDRRGGIAKRIDALCVTFPEIRRVDVHTDLGLITRTPSGWVWNVTIPFDTRNKTGTSSVRQRGSADRTTRIDIHHPELWVPFLVEGFEVTNEKKRRIGEAIGDLYLNVLLGRRLSEPAPYERHDIFIEICRRVVVALGVKRPTAPECVHVAVAVGIERPNPEPAALIPRWEKRLRRAAW